ncbi:tetrapyrrole (corrin/porphyrin) methylase-like protein [Ezakiella coagulans]|uniref:Tetrapyrrole (Corrin/porphyrin) methylase-like protein n=1 Tax=Ezakiella coagulans TaxID=46507 RepID=A0A2U1E3L8_9FIRM|nr:SAM-dependent methyltransferase [Ezakiella coagulans]PVY94537.1 tetrapyrrole (corrin/porphyrin) methylase-like protein [Ezakiella coagulans]
MKLTIVGLGFGEKKGITLEAIEKIKSSSNVILRTKHHPTVELLDEMGIKYKTCDELYEKANNFEELYRSIAKKVLEESREKDTVYVVPGAPSILESTAFHIIKDEPDVEIVEAVSFIEPCVTASKVDIGEGLVMVDAVDVNFFNLNPNFNIMITQLWNEFIISDVKLALMEVYGDEYEIEAIYSAGIKGEEEVKKLKVYEMDRILKPDIRLSLVVPTYKGNNFLQLLNDVSNCDNFKNIDKFDIDPELKSAVLKLSESYKNLKNLVDEGYYEMNEVVLALKTVINRI